MYFSLLGFKLCSNAVAYGNTLMSVCSFAVHAVVTCCSEVFRDLGLISEVTNKRLNVLLTVHHSISVK
jgi:hypothetical protein